MRGMKYSLKCIHVLFIWNHCYSGDVKPVASSEEQDKQMKMRLALAARLKKEVIQGKWMAVLIWLDHVQSASITLQVVVLISRLNLGSMWFSRRNCWTKYLIFCLKTAQIFNCCHTAFVVVAGIVFLLNMFAKVLFFYFCFGKLAQVTNSSNYSAMIEFKCQNLPHFIGVTLSTYGKVHHCFGEESNRSQVSIKEIKEIRKSNLVTAAECAQILSLGIV